MRVTSANKRIFESAEPPMLVCAGLGPGRNYHMNKKTRRKLEMGRRALEFCKAHPDSSPEYNAAVARLEALLARARELEMLEKNERKLRRRSSESAPNSKVIPFELRSSEAPPDPAA
jgi:hypothetical protein